MDADLQNLEPWVADFVRQLAPATPSRGVEDAEAQSEQGAITTEAQLRDFVWGTFGVTLPNVQVCPDHTTPWRVFCDIYFARHSMTVVKGSRGLSGKTYLSALLGLTFALTLKGDVTILGGSGEQSARLHKAMSKFMSSPNAPRDKLLGDASARRTKFAWGNEIVALTASQASVRGPHPQMLLLDEIDEMDLDLFDAAMGQTMSQPGIPARTAAFSTHQYDDRTMAEVMKRFPDRVRSWCYKETLQPHGWLDPAEVVRKRSEMTAVMWDTEVELQEPNPEGRAIDTALVDEMFLGETIRSDAGDGQFAYREFEPPVAGAWYSTGADWARHRDYVEFATLRCDVFPLRLVAYQRFRKRPTPLIIEAFERQRGRYPGHDAHDATGGGTYIADFVDAQGVTLSSARRRNLFTDYIVAIEDRSIVAPRIEVLYKQHRNVRNADLWGSGHPPDGFVAGALAYHASGSARNPLRLVSAPTPAPVSVRLADGTVTRAEEQTGIARALSFLSQPPAHGNGHRNGGTEG